MPKEEVIEHINSYGNIVWSGGLHINYVIVHQWQGRDCRPVWRTRKSPTLILLYWYHCIKCIT